MNFLSMMLSFLFLHRQPWITMIIFQRNWKGNLWMIKRSYKNPKRAARHGLPFGSYITLTDMVRSSLETT